MPGGGSFYHCSVKTISRSANRSVVAAAAYRMGESLYDVQWDKTHDYTRRGGVLETFTLAPEDAPDWAMNPAELWNAAEQREKRVNSTVGREVELALPAFLSSDERRAIVEEFAGELVDRYGVAVTGAIHSPGRGDDRNYHAHILFTTRVMTADGLGEKTRILDSRQTGPGEVKKLRELAADIINKRLAAVNSDIRVDHRSFAERGIENVPTVKLGPGDSARERNGRQTENGDYNRKAEEINEAIAERDALARGVDEKKARLAEPPKTAEDAMERLQDDRQLVGAGIRAAAQLEKALPADRKSWRDRALLFVARKAKGWFDRMADRALQMARLDPERRKRQQPTAQDRRWQSQEQARQQAEKNRGRDI